MALLLSQFAGVGGLQVVQDGAFLRTGKLSTRLAGLCVPLRSPEHLDELHRHPSVAAVITTPELADSIDGRLAVAVAPVPQDAHSSVHARLALAFDMDLRRAPTKIHPTAAVDPLANIASYGVVIGPGASVEAFCRVSPGAIIEEGCTIRSGCAVGLDGFHTGIVDGRHRILPQVGGVRLRPYVELMPGVTIGRAVYGGETVIGEECAIDTQAYIAHDTVIGKRATICAMANIMGRVEIGDDVHIGPSAVIINGARIGDRAYISMGSVVTRDVPAGERVTGNFAIPHSRFIENLRRSR